MADLPAPAPTQRPELDVKVSFISLVEILRWRAAHRGKSVAFRFLPDGENEQCVMTYGQLEREVLRLAGRLQAAELAGERALLLYPTGPTALIAVLACLAAGVVAVPLGLPRPNRSSAAWQATAADCQPRAALTSSDVLQARGGAASRLFEKMGLPVLATDAVEGGNHPGEVKVASESLAYLQYTSGSTAAPKGVMVTHANVWQNCRTLASIVGDAEQHVGVGWLPSHHDMGLVGTMFLPLWMGFPIIFMPPEAFLMKPVRWLRAMTRYRATISPAPNFAFDLCTRRVAPDEQEGLDLSRWRFAFNGAERVDAESLDCFTRRFEACGFRAEAFYPCYGLAESTLLVSGGEPRRRPVVRRFDRAAMAAGSASLAEDGVALVGCGHAWGDADLKIVAPESGEVCPPGHIGEIWISGPSVAAGYWNDPQATAVAFGARLARGSEPYLRTGDLGFLWEDELFITGRLKDLLIIGGRNIAAEDIEASVEGAHPAIRPGGAVAFAVEGCPHERLIVVAEVMSRGAVPVDSESIIRAVRDRVATQNDVPVDSVVLVRRHLVPRTPNGKKRRAFCREKFLRSELGGPRDD